MVTRRQGISTPIWGTRGEWGGAMADENGRILHSECHQNLWVNIPHSCNYISQCFVFVALSLHKTNLSIIRNYWRRGEKKKDIFDNDHKIQAHKTIFKKLVCIEILLCA